MKKIVMVLTVMMSMVASAQLTEPGVVMHEGNGSKLSQGEIAMVLWKIKDIETSALSIKEASKDPQVKVLSAQLSSLLNAKIYIDILVWPDDQATAVISSTTGKIDDAQDMIPQLEMNIKNGRIITAADLRIALSQCIKKTEDKIKANNESLKNYEKMKQEAQDFSSGPMNPQLIDAMNHSG